MARITVFRMSLSEIEAFQTALVPRDQHRHSCSGGSGMSGAKQWPIRLPSVHLRNRVLRDRLRGKARKSRRRRDQRDGYRS
jgi:hypothetical protein